MEEKNLQGENLKGIFLWNKPKFAYFARGKHIFIQL
jgi:hypothetical protein